MTVDLPAPGVFRRLAAIVYDCFLLFAILFVATLIPALLFSHDIMSNDAANNSVVHELNSPLQGVIYQLYLLSLIALFYSWFWRKSGQTLGMQAWRLKLERSDGGQPSWLQCGIRLLVAIPALGLAGLGYWWIWLDRDGLAWHDRASNTRLRALPKASKNSKDN